MLMKLLVTNILIMLTTNDNLINLKDKGKKSIYYLTDVNKKENRKITDNWIFKIYGHMLFRIQEFKLIYEWGK